MHYIDEAVKFLKFLGIYIFVYGSFYFTTFAIFKENNFFEDITYLLPTLVTLFSIIVTMLVSKYIEIITLRKFQIKEMAKVLDSEFTTNFTTNIHHELSTPIMLLENAFYNVTNKPTPKEIVSNRKTFETSYNQVMGILAKSSNIKECRITPDISVERLIVTAFDNLSMSYKFEYNLTGNFNDIKIKRFQQFENTDFINVIFALAKNSLEAGANRFDVNITKTLHSYIILFMDNGDGIRDARGKVIKNDSYSKIFRLHYSTKDNDGTPQKMSVMKQLADIVLQQKSSRGVGLWLNKTLLSYAHIDLSLQKTTKNGSIFKIQIPTGVTYV